MAKEYSLMCCRECGFPRMVSFLVKWNSNGSITQLMRRDFRVVILHFGFLDNLFSGIEARLGLSIEHIAFEAQRNASKAVFEAFKTKIPGVRQMLRFKWPRRVGVEQFNKVGIITGQCHSQTLDYEPGVYGVARIRNPFHLQLMAANVVGAFEVLEEKPFSHSWEEVGKDSYLITVRATGLKPEISGRMDIENAPLLPGNLAHARCPRCKVPMGVTHLKWMENDGIILDTRTGARVIMLDGYMVTTVFREMARELGEDINALIVEAQKDWTIEHVGQLGLTRGNGPVSREGFEVAYRKYLSILPLYGQGNPVTFEMKDSTMHVVVENPCEPYFLAGTLQGLYEALEKTKSSVSREEVRHGAEAYTVRPA